jgi:hypothetical protein
LPDDYVRVSRIAVKEGQSMIGREVPHIYVPELMAELGIDVPISLDINAIANLALQSGKPVPIKGPEDLQLKRSLVNGSQRLEITGWSLDRLEWYKVQGCFTEIIRYQTRLFVPVIEASDVLQRIAM